MTSIVNKRNYRLVAHQDNLAVRYMDVSSMPGRDVAGVSRPGSTDVGAFQSVSTRTVSSTIGPAAGNNYTTAQLWFNSLETSSVVNGDTLMLIVDDGIDTTRSSYFQTGDTVPQSLEIDLTYHLKSKQPTLGSWTSGTIVRAEDESINRLIGPRFKAYRNNIGITIEDFVFSGGPEQNASNQPVIDLYNYAGDFPENWWNGIYRDTARLTTTTYDVSSKFINCLVNTYDSNQNALFRNDYADTRVTDDEGNTSFGTHFSVMDNCVLIGNSGGIPRQPTGFNGYVLLGVGGFKLNHKLRGCVIRNCTLPAGSAGGAAQSSKTIMEGCIVETGSEVSAYTVSGEYTNHLFTRGFHYDNTYASVQLTDCIFNQASGGLTKQIEYHNGPLGMLASSIASGLVVNTQFDVPFVYGVPPASGEVSFRPPGPLNSTLVPYVQGQGSLGIDYAVNSELPLYDIAGVLRDSDPNAGAYEGSFVFVTYIDLPVVPVNLYN
jgi:hypothetical protein